MSQATIPANTWIRLAACRPRSRNATASKTASERNALLAENRRLKKLLADAKKKEKGFAGKIRFANDGVRVGVADASSVPVIELYDDGEQVTALTKKRERLGFANRIRQGLSAAGK